MLKKVLLSILFLTAISCETEAKGRFSLSDGQKKVLKIGGKVLGTVAGLYSLIALIQARHKAYINRHIVPYSSGSGSNQNFYPENNPTYNYYFKLFNAADCNSWLKNVENANIDFRNYDVFVKQDNCESRLPKLIEANQRIYTKYGQKVEKTSIKVDKNGKIDFDACQSPCFLRRFVDAFASPLQIIYQTGQDLGSICSHSSAEAVP